MKLKDLKEIIDNLSEEQLDGELIAKGQYWDGVVYAAKPSEENLYWLGDDDPSELITEDEMKERVEEEGEDKMPEPYLKKGQILLHC
jgi:hypothetical protein